MSVTTKSHLELSDGMVRLVTTRIELEAPDSKWLDEMASIKPVDSGPLPQGGSYIKRKDGHRRTIQLFTIERAPGMYTFTFVSKRPGDPGFNEKDLTKNGVVFTVSWPYMLYIYKVMDLTISSVWLVASQEPLYKQYHQTPISITYMPNTYREGHANMCIGEHRACTDLNLPIVQRVGALHQHMLESPWNRDLLYRLPPDCGIKDLQEWNDKSAKDVLLWQKIRFRPHELRTYGGLIERLSDHDA